MEKIRIFRRKIINKFMLFISFLAALYGLFWLFWILGTLFVNGFKHINWELFVQDSGPPGLNIGGLRQAFVGHFIITILATIIGVPIGLFAGIYYAEYGKNKM